MSETERKVGKEEVWFVEKKDEITDYQYPILPTGCEATSISMLLNWLYLTQGIPISVTKEEIAHRLPKEPNPHQEANTGRLIGGNPRRAFIGDPFTPESFGIFHEPVIEFLRKELPEGWTTLNLTGKPWEELLQAMSSTSSPAIIWCTLRMQPSKETDVWIDCKDSSNEIRWKSPQHCAVLVGFNQEFVWLNDPDLGRIEKIPQSLFRERWEELGSQAVVLQRI